MAAFLDTDERFNFDADIGGNIVIDDRFFQIDQDPFDTREVTPDQVTANQNDYPLPDSDMIRLSTDASRTFTGFSGARPGTFMVVNVGAQDVVIANNSGSSLADNRVFCHTGANITLNPNESVFMRYDFTSLKWRTVGFV